MAHEIVLNLATKVVLHKDIEIEVKKDDKRLGHCSSARATSNGSRPATP